MSWYFPPLPALILLIAGSAPAIAARDLSPSAPAAVDTQVDTQADSSAPPCPRREDDLWLISTRHLGTPCWEEPASYDLDVRRYRPAGGDWQEVTIGEYFEQPPLPTVVHVHGNRADWWQAWQDGWRIYDAITRSDHVPARMRFVIWSWPSDQIRGPLKDVRAKADRADQETFFLGWFLSRCRPGNPPSLIGYSYGARIVTGGLHLLAGGAFHGRRLPHPGAGGAGRHRVALLAAALDCDWLSPGHWHGDALQRADRLLVLFNTCDPALKHYDRLDRCTNSALGFVGSRGDLGAAADRVEELNVAPVVGRSHDAHRYFRSASLQEALGRVLFAPLPTGSDSR